MVSAPQTDAIHINVPKAEAGEGFGRFKVIPIERSDARAESIPGTLHASGSDSVTEHA